MPVIINELEVLTEPSPAHEDATAQAAQQILAQRQAPRQTSPEAVRAILRHDLRRKARSYAG